MAYDEKLDGRIQSIISGWKSTKRKMMFGGTCYLTGGRMFSGVYKDSLILRLGEKGAGEALRSPHTRPMDVTGRPMRGWVMMGQKAFRKDEELEALLEEAREFTEGLKG